MCVGISSNLFYRTRLYYFLCVKKKTYLFLHIYSMNQVGQVLNCIKFVATSAFNRCRASTNISQNSSKSIPNDNWKYWSGYNGIAIPSTRRLELKKINKTPPYASHRWSMSLFNSIMDEIECCIDCKFGPNRRLEKKKCVQFSQFFISITTVSNSLNVIEQNKNSKLSGSVQKRKSQINRCRIRMIVKHDPFAFLRST